jgi:uncharacterized membrane protein
MITLTNILLILLLLSNVFIAFMIYALGKVLLEQQKKD